MTSEKNEIVGFTCGAMDLLHAGHILMLKEAKEQCDWLIVGLHEDPSVDRARKNSPIQNLTERRIQLEGCRYVDEIQEYSREKDLSILLEELRAIHGDRLVRIIGEDWRGKKFTGHDLDINIVYNSRSHNYSSTELRKRICEFELREENKRYHV